MRVKKFIDKKLCSKKELVGFIETMDQVNLLLSQLFEKMADCLIPYKGKEITGDALSLFKEKGSLFHTQMLSCYLPEWFSSEQVMEDKKKLMFFLFQRAMPQLLSILEGATLVAVNERAVLEVEENGERFVFSEPVHFILKKGSAYQAIVINGGKNSAKKSLNGRTDHTRIDIDLRYAVIKAALEEKYSGISLTSIFYQEGEVKGELNDWVSNGTQKSNVFHMDFCEFYEDGSFLQDVLIARASEVVNLSCQKNQTDKCNACPYSEECLVQKFSERKMAVKKEGTWKVPSYDERQKEFIDCNNDEILVCAGPGSGKTASLIGRVLRLVQDGFSPEKMLLVTYTDKAAGELRSRLLGKFSEDEMPRICTLHSIALEIDKVYAKISKTKAHSVLSDATEKRLLKEILSGYDWHLTGVDYRNFESGDMRYNTVGIVYTRLKFLRKDPDAFYWKYKDFVKSEWDTLVSDIEKAKKESRYLTYDEYITNASKILKQSSEMRLYYQSCYEHVMVDEFQDINAEQSELISMLKGNGRLACIGDDDQAIYAFKGCSSRFMQGFSNTYPNAKVIFCNTNYRSTKGIIAFNNSILSQMDEKARISKVIEYAQYAEDGRKPVLYNQATAPLVEHIVKDVMKRGYRYGDIAVLATKNSTLEVLHDILRVPTELASAFVVKDFLFHAVLNTLSFGLGTDKTLNPLYRLGLLYEKDIEWFKNTERKNIVRDEVYDLLVFSKTLLSESPSRYVARLSAYLDLDESSSEKEVMALAEQVSDLTALCQLMQDMKVYGDNKKIEYPIEDKVTLITSHSCKGMEWPVVIIYDTENFDGEVSLDGKKSMDARLFYVAASRAQKELFFLKKENSETIIDSSTYVDRRNVS